MGLGDYVDRAHRHINDSWLKGKSDDGRFCLSAKQATREWLDELCAGDIEGVITASFIAVVAPFMPSYCVYDRANDSSFGKLDD
jgi:hypothetical protein